MTYFLFLNLLFDQRSYGESRIEIRGSKNKLVVPIIPLEIEEILEPFMYGTVLFNYVLINTLIFRFKPFFFLTILPQGFKNEIKDFLISNINKVCCCNF